MSLWIPRPSSSAVLTRSSSRLLRQSLTSSSPRYIPLIHLQQPTSVTAGYRFESTKSTPPSSSEPKASPPATKDSKPLVPWTTRAWKKVKHEANHYWHGTKLLVSEVRISSRLQWKILHGDALTRRERRQVSSFLRVP